MSLVWAFGLISLGTCTRTLVNVDLPTVQPVTTLAGLAEMSSGGGGSKQAVVTTTAPASEFRGPELDMYVLLEDNAEAEGILNDRALLQAQLVKTFPDRHLVVAITDVQKLHSKMGTVKYVVKWRTSTGELSQEQVVEKTGTKGEKMTSNLWTEEKGSTTKETKVTFKLTNTLQLPKNDGEWKDMLVAVNAGISRDDIAILKVKHNGLTASKKNLVATVWWTTGQGHSEAGMFTFHYENVLAWSGQDLDLTKTKFEFKVKQNMTLPNTESGWKDYLSAAQTEASWGEIHTAKVKYLGVDSAGTWYFCEVFWYRGM